MSDLVVTERVGRVGVVLMNRPKQLNALSGELMGAVIGALQELDADSEIRAIVLGGGERAFAAGADITELAAGTSISLYENRRIEQWDRIRALRLAGQFDRNDDLRGHISATLTLSQGLDILRKVVSQWHARLADENGNDTHFTGKG